MRKVSKCIFISVIGATILLLLASCGAPAAKSESDIRADISGNDRYFSDYNLTLESMSVVKRQTNQEDKTDYVWISVTAKNNDFTYNADYELMYVLYNEGWLLENYTRSTSDFTPNYYPTVDDAATAINNYADGCTLINTVSSEKKMTYQFKREETKYYLTTEYRTDLVYEFTPGSGWRASIHETELSHKPDIVGEWIYQDDLRYFYVNIISVEDEIVTLEYNLENVHTSYSETTTKKTTSPVRIELGGIQRTGYSICLDPYSVYGNIHIYVGDENYELTESTGCGVSCDGYFLKRTS
ncbi:MAG: hypothetical protein E7450_04165 [Ruminococcaceae bacterium]|nr:hypothetical protein [Oscillospiraceae bacterium]